MSVVRQLLKVSTILKKKKFGSSMGGYKHGKAEGAVQIIKEQREPGLSSKQLEYFLTLSRHRMGEMFLPELSLLLGSSPSASNRVLFNTKYLRVCSPSCV